MCRPTRPKSDNRPLASATLSARRRADGWQSDPAFLSAVVDTSTALVCVVDADGSILLFNPACERAIGWTMEEAVGRPSWEVFRRAGAAPEPRSLFGCMPAPTASEGMQSDWFARDGSVRTIVWSTRWHRRAADAAACCLATGVDVTALRGAEEKLHYLGHFDALTGLPNQILLRDRVMQLQEQVVPNHEIIGFLLVKFERLGLVSENLGAGAEQAILVESAARLAQWAQGRDSVARVGEGAFAVVAVRQSVADLSALAGAILLALAAPFTYQDQALHLDACIGMAVVPGDGGDYDAARQGAEAAARRAMTGKVERYALYQPALNQDAQERFKLESDLRHAVERGEFLLHYQPQVSLADGAIVGIEALVRWQHPVLGLVAPNRFIPLAEETGLILPIGEWVLRHACQQSCAWQREGLPAVPVSVNLSARQLSGPIVATVARVLAETGLVPRLLELELTESASMDDPEMTFTILTQLKQMGVKLAIDDFGTGYSNLSYLKRFPVHRLKLDQSFVRDITRDPDDLAIARAVVAMAHGLRLKVIAEGVETPGQLALLANNGCDEIQGYFFSRPVAADACARMLREDKRLDLHGVQRAPCQRTVLYVDDEVNLLSAMRRNLKPKGYHVLVATSAAEAFEILATCEVGVILCDQRMPGMSGTAFLARVKHLYPAAARIVLSGYGDLQTVTDAVNHGAIFKFLGKPWDEDALVQAIRDGFAASLVQRPQLRQAAPA